MKKILFGAFASCIILLSCSKSDDTPAATEKYLSVSAGSTWNYQFINNITLASNAYTLTSSSNDTAAVGKTYHVFTNSNGPNEYYNITGSDYYRLQAFSLGTTDTTLENLYLKDGAALNSTWAQTYTIDFSSVPVGVTVTNKIQEKGITKVLGTTTYSNVIHVVTTISIPALATVGGTITTDIHYYYAPKYGMIENDVKIDIVSIALGLDQHNDSKTTLTSANIL